MSFLQVASAALWSFSIPTGDQKTRGMSALSISMGFRRFETLLIIVEELCQQYNFSTFVGENMFICSFLEVIFVGD